jgi:hypothetical protein
LHYLLQLSDWCFLLLVLLLLLLLVPPQLALMTSQHMRNASSPTAQVRERDQGTSAHAHVLAMHVFSSYCHLKSVLSWFQSRQPNQ